MKIVIDISEDDLDAIKYLKVKGWASKHELLILNGVSFNEVLDKIKADISSYGTNSGMLLALEIIDKYRESEGVK